MVLAFFLFSCGQHESQKREVELSSIKKPKGEIMVTTDSQGVKSAPNVLNLYSEFRTAIYQGDRRKVKTFFEFPIYNPNNEIWYLAYSGDEKRLNRLTENIKPFSENEFDTHYDRIFPKPFIKCIMKINAEILFDKGEYETEPLLDKNNTYKVIANYDRKSNTLILNFVSTLPIVINDGENDIVENSEFSIIYYFEIVMNKAMKFKQVRIAG